MMNGIKLNGIKLESSIPTRAEAEDIFAWAYEKNPEPWAKHCQTVARAAETIASKCGLNPETAYIMGLFHDIGYCFYKNGKGSTCHIYSGYKLMMEKGYEAVARICLTHSFPSKDFRAYGGSDMTCSEEEKSFISAFIAEVEYDDYDKLIQLCDCYGTAQGIVPVEKRLMNVVMRHGFNEFTVNVWESFLGIKEYFDAKCGTNINNLFCDEIKKSVFD